MLGRPIQPSDDTEAVPPVAVISYRMWQRRLGLDPHIIGANFSMNGVVATVVGVTAPEYQGEIVQSDPPAPSSLNSISTGYTLPQPLIIHFSAHCRLRGAPENGVTT